MERQVPGYCDRREHDVLQEHIKGRKGQLQRASEEKGRLKKVKASSASFYPKSNWKLRKSSQCWLLTSQAPSESSSSGSVLRKARSHLSGRTYRVVCM